MKNPFRKKSLREKYPPLDKYQEAYREKFGCIIDKYLISHEDDGNGNMLIVYIDVDNDIDWSIRGNVLDEIDEKELYKCLAQLDIAQTFPTTNLCDADVMRFKIILGAGYNAALHGNFEEVKSVIEKAYQFAQERNKEQSRYLILSSSTLVALAMIILSVASLQCEYVQSHKEWLVGFLFGGLGAYVSVWQRSGNINMTGLASCRIHYLEAFARLFCGVIFGCIGVLLLKTGIFLSGHIIGASWFFFAIVGFMAGFNERFVPTIIERITTNK